MDEELADLMETTKAKLLRALSTMDEFASYAVADNDNGEAEELARAYNVLFDHLNNL